VDISDPSYSVKVFTRKRFILTHAIYVLVKYFGCETFREEGRLTFPFYIHLRHWLKRLN
jgi:hypothetical protein